MNKITDTGITPLLTKQKVALITGQDGPYLAEVLLEKGYIVHGIKRLIGER